MVIKKYNIKVIILGLIITIISTIFTFNYEIEKEKLHFITYSNKLFNNIEGVFSTFERINNDLSSRFYLPEEINKERFSFFTSSIINQNNLIESIFFAKNINIDSRKEYEQDYQNKGYTGFLIRPFQKKYYQTSPHPDYLLPIIYYEPYNVKNSRFFGLDLFTHSVVSDLFSKAELPQHLAYKKKQGDKNSFYAIKPLYKGHGEESKIKHLSSLYGVLFYKININIEKEEPIGLSIKVNNEKIYSRTKTPSSSQFDFFLESSRKLQIAHQKINLNIALHKSFFSLNLSYPIIVFLLGVLLTALTWKIIYSHEELNLLLRKQKELVEAEVQIQTNELKNRADELEAFSYSVSHDLKSPLHSVDGYTQLLKASYGDTLDEEAINYLDHIYAAANKMEHIINDLLSLSHVSLADLNTEYCNLSDIAAQSMDSIQDQEDDHKTLINIQKDIYANVDPNFLHLCFDNLFSNAWKYSSKVKSPQIEFGIKQEDNKTIYYVKDNGAGFSMLDANKLFIPFQRLHHHSEFEGTGVGLMIVKRVIQKHNGEIWAESEPGKGATFYFTLNTNT